MQRCSYRRGEWECPENTSNGDKCIFHRDTSKDINELERRFIARLTDKAEDPVRFDGAIFPESNIFRRTYEKSVSFTEAIFSKGAVFGGAKFLGEKSSFEGARFNGDADFIDAQFEGKKIIFKLVQFLYKTNFNKAKFICEEIDFSNANFGSNQFTIFDEALLNSNTTSFAGATFNSPTTSFVGTQFCSKKEIKALRRFMWVNFNPRVLFQPCLARLFCI
ncbi:MAG: pentapeptide repeat-containing protein [Deltaproteobacteria bacterium]|nr:pentapeptide repeat-containing protein [Deltaproteobacteria bacterium]